MPSKKQKQKWEPSAMQKHPDTIISSDYANSQCFRPTYENEPVNMFLLMSNEYSRLWYKERELNKKVIVPEAEADFIQRKYVIRGLLKKKQTLQPKKMFKLKQFQNVKPKISVFRPKVFEPKNKEENISKTISEENLIQKN